MQILVQIFNLRIFLWTKWFEKPKKILNITAKDVFIKTEKILQVMDISYLSYVYNTLYDRCSHQTLLVPWKHKQTTSCISKML